MTALYGFSGSPRPDWLEQMGGALTHRGDAPAEHLVTPHASIGWAANSRLPPLGVCGGGCHCLGDAGVAVAGFLTAVPQGAGPPLKRLLNSYLQGGVDALRHVRGDYVMAIRQGTAIDLVRDGPGARSLYYAWHEGRMFFAVEPKAIVSVAGFPRRLYAPALAQYLAFSFVPGSRTMLQDVRELPAGHAARFSGSQPPEIVRYFQFERNESDVPLNGNGDGDPVAGFRNALALAVESRMPKQGPVGVFLSGGLDSSVVTAEAARQAPGRVTSYALHFGPKYANELSFAREVADRCGTTHHEIQLRPRHFLPRLRSMIRHLDDPIGDPVTMPNYELSRMVSQDQCVVFNGEGGDPCFGGPKNLPMMLQHWYGGIDRGEHFRERAYLASYRRAYEEIQRLLTPEAAAECDYQRDLVGVLRPFFRTEQPKHFLNKLMSINIRLKGANLILPKVERMTGAWQLTPLAPLFSQELVDLSMRLPPQWKLHRGVEKIVLKRAYENHLPSSVIQRPKSGMRVPVHFWFRGELKRYARKVLSPRALRSAGIFQPDRVKQLLNYDTVEGPGRYGLRLWMLLTFEIWRRIVIEREAV